MFLCCVALNLTAETAGGYAGVVQRMPLSAMAIGRGGASTARPDFAMAYWNPARAGSVERLNLSLGGAVLPLGRSEGFIAGESRLGKTRLSLSGLFSYHGIRDLGTQYFDDGSSISDESFTTLSARAGLGFAIHKTFSLGMSLGWLYGSMPVDYRNGSVIQGKSSALGGVSVLGSWNFHNGLYASAGVKDILVTEIWNESATTEGYALTLSDTTLSPLVAAVSYNHDILGMNFRVDSDLNMWLFNSYFSGLDHPFTTMNSGVTWGLNEMFAFRVGLRNLLFTSTMFSDPDLYKIESSPRLSGGVGLTIPHSKKLNALTMNYALSSSGSGAGIDHYFDFLFAF